MSVLESIIVGSYVGLRTYLRWAKSKPMDRNPRDLRNRPAVGVTMAQPPFKHFSVFDDVALNSQLAMKRRRS